MIFWIEMILWISVLGLVHTYLIYPLSIIAFAHIASKKRSRDHLVVADSELPSVTVLIAAYNAEAHISARLENLFRCDYPQDRLQIVIASDGSTDNTVPLVRSFPNKNVHCVEIPDRIGKAAALVRAMESIESEIVLFTDASTHFSTNAIRAMASRFLDPSVGIVSGRVKMLDESGESSEGLYWKLESLVRRAESELGILTGVSGAIYGVRRSIFVAPNRPTTNDDMVFPILAKHHHECEFLLEESAVAEVVLPSKSQQEFRRRRRIGCGAFQSIGLLLPALMPTCGVSAFALLSHKVLRWFSPFLLISTLVSNVALAWNPNYESVLMLQTSGYLLAWIGWQLKPHNRIVRFFRIGTNFVVMNIAIIAGFFDWLAARGSVTWEPTLRTNQFTSPSR